MPQYDSIAFISDMGIKDESVGVCKAVMLQQAPHVTILDITHQVPVFDVRAGALALTRAIQFLPSGVIVAAVDPGSPRDQRYIAVDMGEGVLIGPDNGILAPATQLIGMPKRVHEITNPDYRIEAPGAVFAARDILAPAAGVIAAGVDLAELGPAVPLEQLVPGMLQLARHDEGGAFLGEVWSLDHFGNIQVNITPEEIASRGAKVGDTVIVRVGETDHIAKYVERYADLAVSQLGILVDSTGMISVVKNLDSAARELDIREGKAITILPPNTSVTGRDITIESVAQTPAEAPQSAAPEINLPLTPPAEMSQPIQVPLPGSEAPVVPRPESAPPVAYSETPVSGSFPAPENFGAPAEASAPPAPFPAPTPAVAHDQFPAVETPAAFPAPEPYSEPAVAQQPVAPSVTEPTPTPSDVFGNLITPAPSPSVPLPADVPLVEPPAPAAPYFPPPEPQAEQPPVQPAVQAMPQVQPQAAPENVFDLFKGDDEETQSDPQHN